MAREGPSPALIERTNSFNAAATFDKVALITGITGQVHVLYYYYNYVTNITASLTAYTLARNVQFRTSRNIFRSRKLCSTCLIYNYMILFKDLFKIILDCMCLCIAGCEG